VRRRTLLAGCGAAAGGLLAGCTGPGEEAGTPEEAIVRFSVTNADDVARSIAVEVQQDGEVVASGEGTLPPAGEAEAPFRYGFPSVGAPVTAVVRSDNASRSVPWDPAECAQLDVTVEVVDGEPRPEESCR